MGEFLLGFHPNPHSNDVRGKSILISAPACPSSDEQSCFVGTVFLAFPTFSLLSQGHCGCWVAIPPSQWRWSSPASSQRRWQEAAYLNTLMQQFLLLQIAMDITQKGCGQHSNLHHLPQNQGGAQVQPCINLQSLNYSCSKNTT